MVFRYLETVRRAISTPSNFKISTILSSESNSFGSSLSIRVLMRWRMASAECGSSPETPEIAVVKKYFNS